MDSNGSNGSNEAPADLASILATLAALAPQKGQPISNITPGNSSLNARSFTDTQSNATRSEYPDHVSIRNDPGRCPTTSEEAVYIPQGRQSFHAQLSTPEPRSYTPPPMDPATIIEWPQGLRCVTKIASQNPMFRTIIRKMMAEQERHETMWWNGRRKLLESHGNPSAKKRSDAVNNELKRYDLKVYKATQSMVQSMSGELKSLGVPFFGVRNGLVISTRSNSKKQHEGPPQSITPEQLLQLQRKMIAHLVDMYGP
ncbi:hypothetical protein EJ05DRAFT_535922 [Pseudovirgaria hyperparasitica]|uniref:Uncharacterized protein n=1 Tax=Pseudovirgaria hyperparasitica TaxID=470096 RepID=A0A6A6WE33_9PEZI|nr:uncharacterized protein EJ05DRAFT_535922 [Pseudovirgaria hyperparasitica]KAF2761068.1 hypothetical protein EJ05DRAFT_535922 [Pseudovirgaria hyperparasitica]